MSLNFIFTVDRNVSIFSVKAPTALSIFSDSSCLAVSKASFKIARSSSEHYFYENTFSKIQYALHYSSIDKYQRTFPKIL